MAPHGAAARGQGDRSWRHPKVAADAAAKPLKDATTAEGKEASSWHESVYGAGAAARGKLLSDTLPKYRKRLDAAAAEYKRVTADKTATKDQKGAAYKKWVAAYDEYKKEAGDPYHALPEEADAWAVAGKMQAAYKKKSRPRHLDRARRGRVCVRRAHGQATRQQRASPHWT